MTMRLTDTDRAHLTQGLGPDGTARMDSVIAAGYVLWCLGVERPDGADIGALAALADYIRTGDT